jgi:hypothetical protein
MAPRPPTVGILAYGSLIGDPGDELRRLISRVIRDVLTPFPVEFARMSSGRGDAPTLVPHTGGAPVRAAVLVVAASVDEASDMLWRRETRKTDTTLRYPGARPGQANAVQIERLPDFAGIDEVLYTAIGANVTPLTPTRLAELAVTSVAKAKCGLDGISYLIAAKSNGIVTPLSSAYEAEILRLTAADNLESALDLVRDRVASGENVGPDAKEESLL